MITSIAYFPSACALNSVEPMSAFLNSCQGLGIRPRDNSMSADAAVIWSVLWNGRMLSNKQVYEHYRSQNKPVIVMDVGTLHRGKTWKVALNNINADGYYGHQENLDWDRPKKLNIHLRQNPRNYGRVLVAGQHNQSLQLQGVDQEAWLLDKIISINKVTDRQIVVRNHPRCRLKPDGFPGHVVWQQPKKIQDTYDSFDLEFEFDAVINYSSGAGILAAIAGVAPITHATSLAYPVSVATVDEPWHVDRDRWLTQICHTEYTVEEIGQGLWAKILKY